MARLLSDLRGANPGVPVVSVGDYNAFEVNDGYVDVLGIAAARRRRPPTS